MSHAVSLQLASLTNQLRDALISDAVGGGAERGWHSLQRRFAKLTGHEGIEAFAASLAQAVTCGCLGCQVFSDQLQGTRAVKWLIEGADPLVREALLLCSGAPVGQGYASAVLEARQRIVRFLDAERVKAVRDSLPADSRPADAAVYFYEQFLAACDGATRRRNGVFYTPHPLVAFVIRSVDGLLQDEFFLEDGLADAASWGDVTQSLDGDRSREFMHGDAAFVRLLDPAMGTGAFLLEAAELMRQRFRQRPLLGGSGSGTENQLWNAYVRGCLLPRIWGQELMLPPLVLAQLTMAAWLADTGFRFECRGGLHFYLANTLQQPSVRSNRGQAEAPPFTVVVGNPPFSAVSDNRQGWMRKLLRGRDPEAARRVANYFSSQGMPLGERKHWLEDDYVKFMRFSHWQIERAGTGIVALVTNHAYLDNSTFRGMREQLLETFPFVSVVDLHGSTRNRARQPEIATDESVFGIEQGVAVSLFRRPLRGARDQRVKQADIWGDRAAKLQSLETSVPESLLWKDVHPRAPHFFFTPINQRLSRQYEAGFRLCDIMPLNSTAAVTARDSFVIGFSREDLERRMRQFANPRISDEHIRERFFGNTRSRKYQPGDTRGWRMAEARQRVQRDPDWKRYLRSCLYRPFDQREVFWASWMIDWPRNNVMAHLAADGNLALIARRQSPPSLPRNYFWVSDSIVIDGVIRSDNRGGESVFPLYLADGAVVGNTISSGGTELLFPPLMSPNFSGEFIEFCTARLGLRWTLEETDSSHETFAPRELFHYIYALFHCPAYRQRFAEQICVDFPRVFLPRKPDLFRTMSRWGKTLVQAHLLREVEDQRVECPQVDFAAGEGRSYIIVEPGYPKYQDQKVWINKTTAIFPVSREVWTFYVGTYQVCRKWLKDRRERVLSSSELDQYRGMLRAVGETVRIMEQLDQEIERHGSWEHAF